MNNNIKNTLHAGVAVALGLAVITACTDTWDEHFDSAAYTPNAFDGTTMQALEQEASDFAEIVKATGFDVELNSSNTYTIWAPANGTFNKDSLLALSAADTTGIVLTRFVKQHIARFDFPLNLQAKQILLLNNKRLDMTAKETHKIGNVNISEEYNNIKCDNGILHVIDGKLPFKYNIFELIEENYKNSDNASKADSSMYAFLITANADSVIENQSVYNGYDENGNKQWVYKMTRRNNTRLRDMNALIYEEDSDYIALIPTIEAYQQRYSIAKSLLNFHPSMNDETQDTTVVSRVDSLRDDYANRFAMTDLFYSRSQNESWMDSLKSTQYTAGNWPEHLYYRTMPRLLKEDKEVNDILAKVGDSIECSNGTSYIFDEYPISIYEQFFRKIENNAIVLNNNFIANGTPVKAATGGDITNMSQACIQPDKTESGTYRYPVGILDSIPELDENGDTIGFSYEFEYESKNYSYAYYAATTTTATPNFAFKIGNNFSGEYDIYVVTTPIWFRYRDYEPEEILKEDNLKGYRFSTYIWEKGENNGYKETAHLEVNGNANATTPVLTAETIDFSHITDTTYVGTHKFQYAYYGQDDTGVIIKFIVQLNSQLRKSYSNSILFTSIILKPHDDDSAPAIEINPSQLKSVSLDALKAGRLNKSNVKTYKR